MIILKDKQMYIRDEWLGPRTVNNGLTQATVLTKNIFNYLYIGIAKQIRLKIRNILFTSMVFVFTHPIIIISNK